MVRLVNLLMNKQSRWVLPIAMWSRFNPLKVRDRIYGAMQRIFSDNRRRMTSFKKLQEGMPVLP